MATSGRQRIAAAHSPTLKLLEDFAFDQAPQAARDVIAHLGTATFSTKRENVILLGPPGTGKTHIASALGVKAVHASFPVLFDTATGWINRLGGQNSISEKGLVFARR